MPKTITGGMQTHLAGSVTSLCSMWHILRTDGVEFFFTDHDRDIVYEGDTYISSSGYQRTSIQNNSSMAVDNMDIMGIFSDDSITETDLRAGLFDYAEIKIFLVNWANLANGQIKMRRGILGEVIVTSKGFFKAEMRGMTQKISQIVGDIYQAECRTDLGSPKCKVPIKPEITVRNKAYYADDLYYRNDQYVSMPTDPLVLTEIGGQPTWDAHQNVVYECTLAGITAGTAPVYNPTIGAETVDGTAKFTARQAFLRAGVVSVLIDQRRFKITIDEGRAVDDWFNGGGLTFETGNNAGLTIEVKDWTRSDNTVEIFMGAPFPIQVGDKLRLYPGCDKRVATCKAKFDNSINFRGDPYVPGPDELGKYPDAK